MKPVQEWTLKETIDYCRKHHDIADTCVYDCPFYSERKGCVLYNYPFSWALENIACYTKHDIELAKAIKVVFKGSNRVKKTNCGYSIYYENSYAVTNVIGNNDFECLKDNEECVYLDEIIGSEKK